MGTSNRRPTKKRIAWLVGVSALTTLAAGLVFYFVALDFIFSSSESLAELLDEYPAAQASAALPEVQTEPHTCGLHAIRSLYRAHGLDPDTYNLRFRLGTDRKAVSVVESSQGTVHPDLYRVLAQDGFHVVGLDLAAAHRQRVLSRHLTSGLKALALIRRPENGNLHWILLQAGEPDRLELVDSLVETPVLDSPGAFLGSKAVSVALIYPGSKEDSPSIKQAYRLGVVEMNKTPGRMSDLSP